MQVRRRVAHLLVDERCHGQAVEAVREGAPQPDVVPPFALVVEAVDAVDAGALVVPPQQEKVLRILDLRAAGVGGSIVKTVLGINDRDPPIERTATL